MLVFSGQGFKEKVEDDFSKSIGLRVFKVFA